MSQPHNFDNASLGVSKCAKVAIMFEDNNDMFDDKFVSWRFSVLRIVKATAVLTVMSVLIGFSVLGAFWFVSDKMGALSGEGSSVGDASDVGDVRDEKAGTAEFGFSLRNDFSISIGTPKFREPMWGWSSETSVGVPVRVKNESGDTQEVSPTKCFSLSRVGGKQMEQFFPAYGQVSPGGVVLSGNSVSGWVYFDNTPLDEPLLLSFQCDKNQKPQTFLFD